MSGLFQTGSHSIANRYTYLPAVSLFYITSVFLCKIKNKNIFYVFIILIIFSLSSLSINQVSVWKSDLSLWENSAKNTDENYYTAYYYSALLIEAGRVKEASKYFYDVIGIENKYYVNFSVVDIAIRLMLSKHHNEAKVILEKAIKNNINTSFVYRELAILEYFHSNNKSLGLRYIKAVLDNSPKDVRANRIYAKILVDKGKYKDALRILFELKMIEPGNEGISSDIKEVLEKKRNNPYK